MSWGPVLGHDEQAVAFNRAVQRGRLAHAYLFVGPTGVGKRLFAEELAKSLLCEKSPNAVGELTACNQCSECVMVTARTHPDFFAVGRPEDANEIPIETMRELCRNFSLKSARGRGKVAILDDADDLNDASANSFLKTLEEPPPRSVFILIGTSLERQLSTVVSRCQVTRFASLPVATVKEIVRTNQATAEEPIPENLIDRVVQLSGGSPGQALLLADPALWEFRQVFLKSLTSPHIDTQALGKSFLQFIEDAGKEGAAQRRRAALFLRLLVQFLNDVLQQSLAKVPAFVDPGDAQVANALLRRWHTDVLLRLLDRCFETEHQLDRYAQLGLTVEGLVDALGQAPATAT